MQLGRHVGGHLVRQQRRRAPLDPRRARERLPSSAVSAAIDHTTVVVISTKDDRQ